MALTLEQINEYLNEHLPYRLNCLLAWDLYQHRKPVIRHKDPMAQCYERSEFLNPAFEVSIVFGRQLLHFLGITRTTEIPGLQNFCRKENNGIRVRSDDVLIGDLLPDKPFYPIDSIKPEETQAFINLIKVANKSVAHLTTKHSTSKELDSLHCARKGIYRISMEYIDGLNKEKVWWYREVEKSPR